MKKFYIIIFISFFINFSSYSDESLVEIKQTLERINRDIIDLQKQVFVGKVNKIPSQILENDIANLLRNSQRLSIQYSTYPVERVRRHNEFNLLRGHHRTTFSNNT